MGNWAEKTFQDSVGIIYSLARDVVTFRERLPFMPYPVVTTQVFRLKAIG